MKRDLKKNKTVQKKNISESGSEWDRVAGWYDTLVGEEGSEYHREVVIPGVLKLLNPGKNEHILDVSCGQGVFCRILSQKGIRVTGVDLSANLIKQAKKKSGYNPAFEHYIVDNAENMKSVGNAAFDAAVSILALQDLNDIHACASEMTRTVKTGGRIVWVIMHPCFRIPRQSHWGFDEAKKIQYRRMDRYLNPLTIPIQTRPGSAPELRTNSHHRALHEYINALAENGCCIRKMEEWISHKVSAAGPRARAENRARNEFPLFLAILAEKI